jgi:putative transposase
MFSTLWRTCSSAGAFRYISGRKTGLKFCAKEVRERLARLGVGILLIEPGSPWENGYIESFIGKLRDELLNQEIFYALKEARILIEQWRRHVHSLLH